MQKTELYYSLLRTAGVLMFLGSAFLLLSKVTKKTPDKERIYQISYGRTVCAKAERTICGLRLSRCTDSRIYECMTNVFYEDLEDEAIEETYQRGSEVSY